MQVSDTAPTVDVNPNNNAGAITISGKELEALPDDPDELQSDLEALAGPSPARTAARCISTDLPPGSFRRSRPFAKFGSTRIRSLPSTTSWATDASRSSPSPEPTNSTGSSLCWATIRLSTPHNPFAGDRSRRTTRRSSMATSEGRSARARRFSSTSIAAISTNLPPSMRCTRSYLTGGSVRRIDCQSAPPHQSRTAFRLGHLRRTIRSPFAISIIATPKTMIGVGEPIQSSDAGLLFEEHRADGTDQRHAGLRFKAH